LERTSFPWIASEIVRDFDLTDIVNTPHLCDFLTIALWFVNYIIDLLSFLCLSLYGVTVLDQPQWPFSPATLQPYINGNPVGGVFTLSAFRNWWPYATTWNSGAGTITDLQLVDTNPEWLGNDFAVDLLNFSEGSGPLPPLPRSGPALGRGHSEPRASARGRRKERLRFLILQSASPALRAASATTLQVRASPRARSAAACRSRLSATSPGTEFSSAF
jgi:hypothetical protein